jgi:hypothetical protein
MKMLAEYLDTAIKFEQMAAQENDPKLKAQFERQAAAYASSQKREPRNTAWPCRQIADAMVDQFAFQIDWAIVAAVIGLLASSVALFLYEGTAIRASRR